MKAALLLNAQENADLVVSEVLLPLQKESPTRVFVLGGIASLAVFARMQEELGHHLEIHNALKATRVPTSDTPFVVHLPAEISERQAQKEQEEYAEGADHGGAPRDLQQPFNTSAFVQPYSQRNGTHDRILCHIKFLTLPIAGEEAFNRLVHRLEHPHGRILYLTWSALIAEQLLLGADTSEGDGIHGAFMVIRWASLAGRQAADAANARLAASGSQERASITRDLAYAVGAMLLRTEEGEAAVDVWLGRLTRSSFVEACMEYEWAVNSHARAQYTQDNLREQYRQMVASILLILERHPARQLHTLQQAPLARFGHVGMRSLAKIAFEPASRERGERASPFE